MLVAPNTRPQPGRQSYAYALPPVRPQACVPGMAQNWRGESPLARCSQSRRLGEGQGRHREVGSGGSPIQNCGATNRNRIGGVVHPG